MDLPTSWRRFAPENRESRTPFVVGQENYTRFVELMTECARATMLRQKD